MKAVNYNHTGFIKIFSDNLYAVLKGKFKEGSMDLNTMGNPALLRLSRCAIKTNGKIKKLTLRQRIAIWRFYSPYIMFATSRYHKLYTDRSGRFHPEYIPAEFYFMWIDRYYNDRDEARYLDNKCYYYKLFSQVKQPELIAMRIGGTWLDDKLVPISVQTLRDNFSKESEVVIKKAVNSEGGFGVSFLSGESLAEKLDELIDNDFGDVVLQRPVRQHPLIAKLHPQSLNTLRIVSLMTHEKVKIYAAAIKIGVGGSRTDNGWQGGIYCGIKRDGHLKNYGILHDNTAVYEHPDLHYAFSGQKVPYLGRAFSLVKKAHSFMGHFRLIAWDVAIDEKGEAVLIEANLSLGGVNALQMCSGPLFGRDTRKVLDEAVNGKRKVTTLL